MVVSDIKERLSPKKAPPVTAAIIIGRDIPDSSHIPVAIGTSATTVPTEVPMQMEIIAAARKTPGRSISAGRLFTVRFTIASTAPIPLAVAAKAPASTKIHII